MTTCAQKQAYLAEAEAAYHAWQLGGQTVEVSTGTKTLRFSAGNVGNLQRYIEGLRNQVAACTGVPCSGGRTMIHLIPQESSRCGPFRR